MYPYQEILPLTLDTYSHAALGLQEASANGFDELILADHNRVAN